MTLGEIQKVMQNLLKEKVPLHDQVTTSRRLRTRGVTRDLDQLTEAVRQGLKRTITHQLAGALRDDSRHHPDPALEKAVAEALQATRQGQSR